VHTETATIL